MFAGRLAQASFVILPFIVASLDCIGAQCDTKTSTQGAGFVQRRLQVSADDAETHDEDPDDEPGLTEAEANLESDHETFGLSSDEGASLADAFGEWDEDGSGDLTVEELNHASLNTTEARQQFMDSNDKDNSGTLSYREFVDAYVTFQRDHDASSEASLLQSDMSAEGGGWGQQATAAGKGGGGKSGRRRKSRRRKSSSSCHHQCRWNRQEELCVGGAAWNGGHGMNCQAKRCGFMDLGTCGDCNYQHCTSWCSHQYHHSWGTRRYCGSSWQYKQSGAIDCSGCSRITVGRR